MSIQISFADALRILSGENGDYDIAPEEYNDRGPDVLRCVFCRSSIPSRNEGGLRSGARYATERDIEHDPTCPALRARMTLRSLREQGADI